MLVHTWARGGLLAIAGVVLMLGVGCSGKPKLTPQDTFWANLTALCGQEFPGEVAVDSTKSPTFRGRPLALRVTDCTEDTVTMPMLVGGQEWVTLTVTREEGLLRLRHAHRPAADGTGPPTGYGGATRGTGSDAAQDFYADEFTGRLREHAADTVWTLEVRPGAVMGYALRRDGTPRRFRAVFDLKRGRPLDGAAP